MADGGDHLGDGHLAVAIGIYLPLELSVVIFAGGLVSMFALRRKPAGSDAREPAGLLFAAGLITGEKKGRWVWWSVVPHAMSELRDHLA